MISYDLVVNLCPRARAGWYKYRHYFEELSSIGTRVANSETSPRGEASGEATSVLTRLEIVADRVRSILISASSGEPMQKNG